MIDDDKFLNSHDMAAVYRVASSKSFMQRFKRDRLKPKEMRMYPDPVNPDTSRGHIYLWRPADVRAHLEGRAGKKAGR